MDTLLLLLSSRSVLVAAWAVIRALISWAAPNVPAPVVAAIDSLAAAVIATIAVRDVRNSVLESRNESSEASNDV